MTATKIQWGYVRDLRDIAAIERSIAADTFWTLAELEQFFCTNFCKIVVATIADEIVGYIMYQRFIDALEIVRIGVHPKQQRCGIGNRLIRWIKSKSGSEQKQVVITVHEENFALQKLLQVNGFQARCVRRNYFAGSRDAFVFDYFREGA